MFSKKVEVCNGRMLSNEDMGCGRQFGRDVGDLYHFNGGGVKHFKYCAVQIYAWQSMVLFS